MVDELCKYPDDVRTVSKPNSWGLALGAAAVLGITASIIVLLYLFEEAPTLPTTTRRFCCPQILDEILAAANLTVDPCQNVFEHTCFAYASRWSDYDARPRPVSADPVRGFPVTEHGRAIAAYYRACLATSSLNYAGGRKAAEAILKYTQVTSPMNTENLLELVFALPLKYGLPSVLDIRLKDGDSGSSLAALHIGLTSITRLSELFSEIQTARVRVDIVDTINAALLSNVGLKDVDQFFQGLDESASVREETNLIESLMTLTTRVTPKEWKNVLDNLINYDAALSVSGVPFGILNATLENFLDPKEQPRTTALALVSSSMHLFSRLAIMTASSEERSFFCEVRAKELQPLWIQDSIGYFPTQPQDVAIRRTYLALVDAITRKLGAVIPSEDLNNLTTELRNVRLVLPSEVVSKADEVPNIGICFAQAYLEGREYMFRAFMHRTRTLQLGVDFLKDLGKKSITSTGKTLVVPTIVYKMLRIENNSDPIVTMPTIGVPLAGAIWRAVFSAKSNNTYAGMLRSYRHCLADSLLNATHSHPSVRPSEIDFLSLESCVEACRSNDWGQSVDKSGRWNLTRAKAFFMTYVAYHHCRPVMGRALPLATYDANALSAFPAYLASYRCSDTSASRSVSACSLERS